MMELYLIRHGQSVNNAMPEDQLRIPDAPLTELGKRQAGRLAEYLAEPANRDPRVDPGTGYAERTGHSAFGITELYTSPMHRALETTRPIAAALGLKPSVRIELHEHGGVFQLTPDGITGFPGRSRTQVMDEFPDYELPDGLTEEGWWDAASGSEPYYLAAGRAIRIASELRRRATDYLASGSTEQFGVAFVSHGTFIDALIKALLNQLPSRSFFYLMYNTAITRIDFVEHDRALLRYVNRVAHLPPEMVS